MSDWTIERGDHTYLSGTKTSLDICLRNTEFSRKFRDRWFALKLIGEIFYRFCQLTYLCTSVTRHTNSVAGVCYGTPDSLLYPP
jgi:hypothetical protein